MAELTKVALKVENNTQFPNNNSGYITPSRLRGFNTDMIDSTVNQEQYNADSASWNNQINALESFSSSLDNNFVSETQFGAYTSSNDGRVNSLQTTASIQQSEIDALIQFTGSVSSVATGSLLVTASAISNVITFTKGDASTFNVVVGADTSALNAFTASQETKDATLAIYTASVDSSISQLNTFTQSQDTINTGFIGVLANLNSFTSSQNTKNSTLATYTGSNDTKWSNLAGQSGSWVTESETGSFARTNAVNNFTATQNFTNVTVSGTASVAFLQVTYESSSVIYSSGSNQFGDAANDVQTLYGSVRVMNELTASGLRYPTTDGTVEQFLSTNGAGTLSFANVRTLYQNIRNMEAVSIPKGTPLYASGSTGDNVNVYIADAGNPLRMPATLIAGDTTLASLATGRAIIFGHIEGVDTNAYPAGTEVYVGVGGGWTATRPTGSTTPIQPLGVVTRQGNNGMGIVMTETPYDLPNIQTGYVWVGNSSNQPIAVATSSIVTQINTGSLATTGSNTFIGNQTLSGSIVISGSTLNVISGSANANVITNLGDTYTDVAPVKNIVTLTSASYAALYSSSTYDPSTLYVVSGDDELNLDALNAFTASQETKNVTLAAYTGSNDTKWSTLASVTASLISETTNLELFTASANVRLNNLEAFTSSQDTKNTTLENVTSSLQAFTASQQLLNTTFATTGSNTFYGDQTIYDAAGGQSVTLESDAGNGWFNIGGTPVRLQNGLIIPGDQNAILLNNNANADLDTVIENVDNVGVRIGAGGPTEGVMQLTNYSLDVALTFTASITEGHVWVGDSTGRTYEVSTGSFGGGGSTDISALNAFTASQEEKNTTLENVTASLQSFTSSQELLNSGFAITGSNTFYGQQTLTETGAFNINLLADEANSWLDINGGQVRVVNGLIIPGDQIAINLLNNTNPDLDTYITNQDDIGLTISPSGGSAVSGIMNLSYYSLDVMNTFTASISEGYVWVGDDTGRTYEVATSSFGSGGGGGGFPYTGTAEINGELIVTGSARGNVTSLSVTSNTASMDLSEGNYFTLQLPASATTHITATNIQPGQTVTLLITTNTSANVTLSPIILEPSGAFYTASASGSKDILSLVAFETSTLYAVSTKNMI
jgi:hypothetical protein